MENKTFVIAEVKSAESDNVNGEFEIIMSTDAIDRDGESILKGAFDPLPESIPVHAFHDFHDPVGRAFPAYNDQGQLVGRGYFASTPRAQEIRQLVADGVISHTSVGFMAAERSKSKDGSAPPEVTGAELLEVSFVSVPSNREAAVLAVKNYEGGEYAQLMEQDAKAGARNSNKDSDRLQSIHDLAVANGAKCAEAAEATHAPESPSESPEGSDGKSPASDVVEQARLRAEVALLAE